jgi:hypothetical protein
LYEECLGFANSIQNPALLPPITYQIYVIEEILGKTEADLKLLSLSEYFTLINYCWTSWVMKAPNIGLTKKSTPGEEILYFEDVPPDFLEDPEWSEEEFKKFTSKIPPRREKNERKPE